MINLSQYLITGTSINRKCIIKISKGKSWIWKKTQLFKFLNLLFFSEADKSNDMRSTDRKLDQSLVLLLKQVVDGKEWWYLPTMNYTPGLSMREVSVLGHSGCTAFRLFIALDLQVHCRNVNSKLNVSNMIYFCSHGFVIHMKYQGFLMVSNFTLILIFL